MFDAESRYAFGDTAWFVIVDRLRLAFRYSAKAAAPGANIAQQHESRGAVVPALTNVGTLGRFANRMQSQSTGELLELMEVLTDRSTRLQPCRLWLRHYGTELNLHQLGRHLPLILHAVQEYAKGAGAADDGGG